MIVDFASLLWEAGLLQFGVFENDAPVRFHFDLLPSYPDVLEQLADVVDIAIPDAGPIERLLCLPDSLPFALAVCMRGRKPLVYSRGQGGETVHELAGAYDVGHPTLLVVNMWMDTEEQNNLIKRAGQVGLDVHGILAVLDSPSSSTAPYPLQAVVNFVDLLRELVATNRLPHRQAEAVIKWLHEKHSARGR